MKIVPFLLAAALLTAAAPPQESKTYRGVVTDTMCKRLHAMNIAPDSKCVIDCVGDGKTYKYALIVGEEIYTLSDQETPAKFAAQKVEVRGVLYPKTKILKVDTMRAVK